MIIKIIEFIKDYFLIFCLTTLGVVMCIFLFSIFFSMAKSFYVGNDEYDIAIEMEETLKTICVQGQFTDSDIAKFKNKLLYKRDKGFLKKFDTKSLKVSGEPLEAFDDDENTYAKCGMPITMTVSYIVEEKPIAVTITMLCERTSWK